MGAELRPTHRTERESPVIAETRIRHVQVEGVLGKADRRRRDADGWRLAPLLALLLALLLACAACTPADERLSGELKQAGKGLRLELQAPRGSQLSIFVGVPWEGADALASQVPGAPPLSMREPQLLRKSGHQQARKGIALLPAHFRNLPNPCALQALARTSAGRSVLGPAYVIRHDAEGLSSQSFAAFVAGRDGPSLLWTFGIPLLLVIGLSIARWPRRLTGSGSLWLLALLLLALLGLRLAGDAERLPVERGLAEPPLCWPATWDLRDDVHERALGPGFRTLIEASRVALSDDLPLIVWSGPKGKDIARAMHLAHELGVQARFFATGVPLPGLSLLVGVPPAGEVLAETECGALCRNADDR